MLMVGTPEDAQAHRAPSQAFVERFAAVDRITHAILFTTFLGLSLTGLPLLFADDDARNWRSLSYVLPKPITSVSDATIELHVGVPANDQRRWKTFEDRQQSIVDPDAREHAPAAERLREPAA